MKSKSIFAFLCVIILVMGIFTGCGKKDDTAPAGDQTNGESRKILVNGSTSVQPLADELVKKYKEAHPNDVIDIQGGGSGVGIKAAMDGTSDIGMSARELKDEEKSLKEYKIAIDGIAVIVNPANSVEDLTTEQIRKIYTGEIKDWSEIGGKSGKITVVTREEGSGTRGAFIELTGLEVEENGNKVDKTMAGAITQGSTGAVMTTVAGDESSIGFASFGSVEGSKDLKVLKVDGNECTEDNIYSSTYKLARPFLLVTKEEPTGLAKDFIDFVLSDEGQNLIEENHYLKVK